jgi:MarR family transcriptional regulator for hemolysin
VAVAPLLMREFRAEMRRSAPHDLSVPLFRSLILAGNRPGATVSDLANHLGVTLPTASVAVGKLAARGLLQTPAEGQRRSLQLTRSGAQVVEQARQNATLAFEQRLASLPAQALGQIDAALAALENALGGTPMPASIPAPGAASPPAAAPQAAVARPAGAGSAPARRPAHRVAPAVVFPQPAPVDATAPVATDDAPA